MKRSRAFALGALLVMLMAVSAHGDTGDPGAEAGIDADDPGPQTLEALVESVRSGSATRRARLADRERRFVAARDERAALLREIEQRRRAAEAEADRLRARFEQGEQELADLETQLDENAGDLREVFNVVRQTAGDILPTVQNSLVSAQFPGRAALVEKLSRSDSVPTASELRALWLLLLDEMNQSGKVSRFETQVISADGTEAERRVTRVGTFAALSEGDYLRYLPESGNLLVLPRQPAGISSEAIVAFEAGEAAISRVALDPSRGSILSLIVQAPDLRERIEQGGIIGYIILLIGLVGLLLAGARFVSTVLAQRSMRVALASDTAEGGHAIAQLRAASRDPDYRQDADALSAKLDEIVMVSAERLRRGLPALAIFAAVSPLLGLLGTVTGMIETFQVITLFGAGDPRLMSGGISQALITTQLGLSVAIPLLLIHSFLQGRVDTLITRLDEAAAELFAAGRAGGEKV